jgi:3-hydroxyisobutyrate dehydrogenase-like beta-hydroxyacid dehydrogenase
MTTPNRTIAFIGLGIMGGPMAAHLVDAGYDVVGHNLSRLAVDVLVERGGRAATDTADAVREADVVITMVPDSPDVEGLVFGEDGILANAKPGTLHIDCSTIRPDVTRRIAEAEVERGIRPVDAPVSGGEAGAVEAVLSIMVGGDSTVLDRKGPTMRARTFAPGFRIDLHHKDLGIVTAAAREAGVAIPLGAHVAQLVASLRAQGHGGLDHSALLMQVDQLSGKGTTT